MNEPAWPNLGCQCGFKDYCICSPAERALRAWAYNDYKEIMNQEQRNWCLGQINKVEGYDALSCAGLSDKWLAWEVLRAWTDYCRDKGLM